MALYSLDFELLDDIALVPPERFPAVQSIVRSAQATRLGPVVEYHYTQRHLRHLPAVTELEDGVVMTAVRHLRKAPPVSSQPAEVEVAWCPVDDSEMNSTWFESFTRRAEGGAASAGFPKTTARALSAAVWEMVDNVPRHSENPGSAVVGYRWSTGEFEFVVADAGIGVLRSLGKCTDYELGDDHGIALSLALRDGVSRFGAQSRSGYGFGSIFRALANLNGHLRFRSGDACLTVDGTSPDLDHVIPSQRLYYQGLMLSVICRPQNLPAPT